MKGFLIVENRKKYFLISAAIILIGLVMMIVNGVSGNGPFNFDVEFSGGTSLNYDIKQDFNNEDIQAIITEVTGQTSSQIQRVVGSNEVMIKLLSIDSETRSKITDALIEKYGITEDDLLAAGDVSATISGEMQRTAILAVAVACAAMLLYVSFRFKNIVTGASAILALLHDALIVLCAYAVLRIPMNYSFIAAILTVVGYSINSTIVIFDRMRETKRLRPNESNVKLVNESVMATLPRSLFTSLTTLLVLIFLYILGVPSVRDFALPIIIGIVAGTYSSVCLSGSIWYSLLNFAKSRKKK